MTEGTALEALGAAVVSGDGSRARRMLGTFDDETARSDGLDLLARLAAARPPPGAEHTTLPEAPRVASLAVELLVECLDETGVARQAVQGFLLDEAAVDDVTQDTLISVAESVASFRGDARFTTWLHQIARNRAVDHVRRQRATVSLDHHNDQVQQEQQDRSPVVRLSSLIASDNAVRDLLSRLPAPYREVVRLRDVERVPYPEMVDVLGRNLNTVRSQVARGRALLAATIERERTHEAPP